MNTKPFTPDKKKSHIYIGLGFCNKPKPKPHLAKSCSTFKKHKQINQKQTCNRVYDENL